ncbi:hypothetical protein GQ651_03840 [Alphaproteobacteria bacterium GH1-50]|uniref:Uncharacterized protein n=1 Tax=Kangsaoukella pontilimi TaxID=2691042 RepID=A0A7C9MCA5_9RHOB|nr:hypothetical protein [Kangsaoukella pontilimi]MXQ06972.1 hypothetical protein [Kangsaoukella pontilimi]
MPRNDTDRSDPKGLIRESYRIEGIEEPECRSIFLDWAIGVPVGEDSAEHVRQLLDRYAAGHPDHPMTKVLTEALAETPRSGRRGGARGRRSGGGAGS